MARKKSGFSAWLDRIRGRRLRAPRDITSGDIIMYPRGSEERVPGALPTVRGFARDLARNNPYASRAVGVLTSHHVGKGIRASIKGDEAFEKYFSKWARSSACDFEGRLNWYGIQSVLTRSMFESGDGLLVMREEILHGQLAVTLQLVDADQLDESAMPNGKNNNMLGGIEIDKYGRVVGYHIREGLDDNMSIGPRRTSFVKAEDVIHLYEILYPGQLRGIPRGAQAMRSLDLNEQLISAALAKARLESCITGIIITPEGTDDSGGLIGAPEEETSRFMGSNVGVTESGSQALLPTESITPNTLISLPQGGDFRQIQTQSVVGVQDYMRITLEACAVAYGTTYSQISGDTNGLNFSTNKAEKIEFNRHVDTIREHFIFPSLMKIIERVRRAFEADQVRDVDVDVHLVPPGRETMEPDKEANAQMTHLLAGGLTWSAYCRERGLDPEDQAAELARDRYQLAALGLVVQFAGTPITALATPADGEAIDPNTGEPIIAPEGARNLCRSSQGRNGA